MVVFVVSWWMVLLAVLPVGVRSQHEDYDPTDGTDPGAPQNAELKKKAIWATIGATGITIVVFLIAISGLVQPPDVQW